MDGMINWTDFEKIDIRVGTVIEVIPFPKARNPSFKMKIDFGPFGIKKSAAQITDLYKREDLEGMQVIAVLNFPAKQIADFMSECLVLGVYNRERHVVLLRPSGQVENGDKVG